MSVTGCYFMAHTLRKNGSVIRSNLTGKISAELAMQLIAIKIALQPDTGVTPIENNEKNKREKSALEAAISDLNIKKSKIEASISAIVTDGSSGESTISLLGGKIQAGERHILRKREAFGASRNAYYG